MLSPRRTDRTSARPDATPEQPPAVPDDESAQHGQQRRHEPTDNLGITRQSRDDEQAHGDAQRPDESTESPHNIWYHCR